MPPFRIVDAQQAGPAAVGILVPPGRRSVVVVRPRAVSFDLLLVYRGEDGEPTTGFHEASRSEAAMLAENLQRALVRGAGTGSYGVEIVPAKPEPGFWVRAEVGAFLLIACRRVAGQPYRPAVFAAREEAEKVAAEVTDILNPGTDAGRELYMNTEHFGR